MWSSNDKNAGALTGDENFTFLGKGVHFKGIVNFEGTVRIDGRLEGEIHTKGTLRQRSRSVDAQHPYLS